MHNNEFGASGSGDGSSDGKSWGRNCHDLIIFCCDLVVVRDGFWFRRVCPSSVCYEGWGHAQRVSGQAIKWAGGVGFTRETGIEKYWRDSKIVSLLFVCQQ
jgi:hypothetical protein